MAKNHVGNSDLNYSGPLFRSNGDEVEVRVMQVGCKTFRFQGCHCRRRFFCEICDPGRMQLYWENRVTR